MTDKSFNIKKILTFFADFFASNFTVIIFLLLLKLIFQFILFQSGYRWLSADDYCRTVKSFEWLQKPVIASGVWLSPHFWLNGLFMIFFRNIVFAASLVNVIFSSLTLIFFYKISELCFNKKTAVISSLIFIFFPFQVWLSMSGLPESIFMFFVITGLFYILKWEKSENMEIKYLVLSAVSIGFSNMFRYEGWLFSIVLVFLVGYRIFRNKNYSKKGLLYLAVASISFLTIIWWLVLNYLDYKDILFFARETSKIYESYNTTKLFQKFIQYPTFIFYIAPITSIFAIKMVWDTLRNRNNKLLRVFVIFNVLELLLLILQGLAGTGGTNMVSRYIVVNAILFIPLSVYQIFIFRKTITVGLFSIVLIINIIWSFYFPQPYREDTFEIGFFTKSYLSNKSFPEEDKIYFEEIEGFYDTFAVEALSNNPSKFILGNLPSTVSSIEKPKGKKTEKQSKEEINILDIRNYLKKNKINLAIVKSDGYTDKLRKMNFRSEEIGDYKIFYIKDRESNVNDSSISLFAKNISELDSTSDVINFGKLLALNGIRIDNTNFGVNPQTVTLDFYSVNKSIVDSIDYENFEFDRYHSILEISLMNNDSVVYREDKRIFSDKNIEDLLSRNNVRQIIVIKPFALLYYTNKFSGSPFESGVYDLKLKIRDNKLNKDLVLYQGIKSFKPDSREIISKQDTLKTKADSLKAKLADTLGIKPKINLQIKKDTIYFKYTVGNIVAVFPDTNYDLLLKKSNVDIYKLLVQNGLKVFFSQRYQGDHFLNWVFTYF